MPKKGTPLMTTSLGSILYHSPILAHAGHDHNREETETQQDQSNETNGESDSTMQETNETETTTETVEEPSLNQTESVTISQIPAVGETIFILIIATPLILYSLKKQFLNN